MHSYIAIQNTYHIFEVALFINNALHDQLHEDKRYASKLLIPMLDRLLSRNNVHLSDLSFIVVNQGPGPFSTLRSIIATVNGLHCATKIPLVGIDGLDATLSEFYNNRYPWTVVLLNAFNNEVYYLLSHHQQTIVKGYKKIDIFLKGLKEEIPIQPIHFIGNAAEMYLPFIKEIIGANAITSEKIPPICSLQHIGSLGLATFNNKEQLPGFLFPFHLKKHPVEEKKDLSSVFTQ